MVSDTKKSKHLNPTRTSYFKSDKLKVAGKQKVWIIMKPLYVLVFLISLLVEICNATSDGNVQSYKDITLRNEASLNEYSQHLHKAEKLTIIAFVSDDLKKVLEDFVTKGSKNLKELTIKNPNKIEFISIDSLKKFINLKKLVLDGPISLNIQEVNTLDQLKTIRLSNSDLLNGDKMSPKICEIGETDSIDLSGNVTYVDWKFLILPNNSFIFRFSKLNQYADIKGHLGINNVKTDMVATFILESIKNTQLNINEINNNPYDYTEEEKRRLGLITTTKNKNSGANNRGKGKKQKGNVSKITEKNPSRISFDFWNITELKNIKIKKFVIPLNNNKPTYEIENGMSTSGNEPTNGELESDFIYKQCEKVLSLWNDINKNTKSPCENDKKIISFIKLLYGYDRRNLNFKYDIERTEKVINAESLKNSKLMKDKEQLSSNIETFEKLNSTIKQKTKYLDQKKKYLELLKKKFETELDTKTVEQEKKEYEEKELDYFERGFSLLPREFNLAKELMNDKEVQQTDDETITNDFSKKPWHTLNLKDVLTHHKNKKYMQELVSSVFEKLNLLLAMSKEIHSGYVEKSINKICQSLEHCSDVQMAIFYHLHFQLSSLIKKEKVEEAQSVTTGKESDQELSNKTKKPDFKHQSNMVSQEDTLREIIGLLKERHADFILKPRIVIYSKIIFNLLKSCISEELGLENVEEIADKENDGCFIEELKDLLIDNPKNNTFTSSNETFYREEYFNLMGMESDAELEEQKNMSIPESNIGRADIYINYIAEILNIKKDDAKSFIKTLLEKSYNGNLHKVIVNFFFTRFRISYVSDILASVSEILSEEFDPNNRAIKKDDIIALLKTMGLVKEYKINESDSKKEAL